MFKRFELNQITLDRLINAGRRRFLEIPHRIEWSIPSSRNLENQRRLNSYVDCHKGERCFILGNGPSLAKMDLNRLQGEITFGLNRIYLLREKYSFLPTYYVCVNELVLEQFSHEIRSVNSHKFLNWNRRSFFNFADASVSFIYTSNGIGDSFNSQFSSPFSTGGTVTFVAMQIAFIMGFSEIILIGVDHSFVDKGIPNRVENRTSDTDPNHFHPEYFPKGSKWQLPDLRRSEQAYSLARKFFERRGRKIIDATQGGNCQVFDKADYLSLF